MKYKTRPLDCWQKAKELRLKHYRDIARAKEEGKLLVTGSAGAFYEVLAGFGDFEYLEGEPYGATIAYNPPLSQECSEAVEARGYARDLCAYMRNYWGSMFLDKGPFGGFPRPDFVFTEHACDSHGKWWQKVGEYLNIPFFCIDAPANPPYARKKHHTEYLVSQLHDFVLWAEKVTGRKYDDEKLIQAVVITRHIQVLWGQICEANKNIPAPLDQKSMYSLYLPAVILKGKKEGVEFYKILRDEVQDRVKNQIAALGNEQCRLWHDNIPPWYSLGFFRHAERYGAIFVGSHYLFIWAAMGEREDGSFGALKTLEELGQVPKNRDEAFRYLAENHMAGSGFTVDGKKRALLRMIPEWNVDGVVFHLNRGCEGISLGQMECKMAIQEKLGLPTFAYEGNAGDIREWNEAQVLDRLEAFLESMGLKKLSK